MELKILVNSFVYSNGWPDSIFSICSISPILNPPSAEKSILAEKSSDEETSESDDEEKAQLNQEAPHGTFGNVMNAMTLGIFGNQKARTGRPVANEYKVKSRGQENFGPADNHPIEEYSEEGYDHTNPKQLKLIKVKKSDTQKIKEMQDIRKEHEEIARQQKEA